MQTEAEKKAKKKYDDKTAVRYGLKFNKNTDADLIAHMNEIENKQAYIKKLIRNDIAKTK